MNLPALIAVMCANREWSITSLLADPVKVAALTRELNLALDSSITDSEVLAAAAKACRAEAGQIVC